MNAPSNTGPPLDLRRSATARWAVRIAVGIVVLLVLYVLAVFGYPWLVNYGVIG